jgi:hypothetical protein
MKRGFRRTTSLAVVLLLAQTGTALADDPLESNPQPYRCEDSVITKVGSYFENDPTSGFFAIFQSKLGVESFSEAYAAVVDRSAGADSTLAKQKVGDKVQVCLIGSPPKDQYCNPDKDSRGRFFRVYNYRLKAAYAGTNANHLCGGA